MGIKILFSAGEFSGDEHLSLVLKEILALNPQTALRGMAGPKTRASGIPTELPLEDYASVMGFFEVVVKAARVFKAYKWFKQVMLEWKPDLLILTDYPDFNLRIARLAKSLGIKTFYYIPPKLWAWRQSRIELIKKNIDQIALIFPFEKKFYSALGYHNTTYVGHPFFNTLKKDCCAEAESDSRNLFFAENGLNPGAPTIALFPGSREAEVRKHWQPMLETLRLLKQRIPNLQAVLACANTVLSSVKRMSAGEDSDIKCIKDKNLEILRFSDAGLIKSGTSNLQAAFYGLPFIMFYKSSYLTELIVKTFVKIKEYSLVNIIRPHTIDEFAGSQINPVLMAERLEKLLLDQAVRDNAINSLDQVRMKLADYEQLDIFKGTSSPAQRVAILALGLVSKD